MGPGVAQVTPLAPRQDGGGCPSWAAHGGLSHAGDEALGSPAIAGRSAVRADGLSGAYALPVLPALRELLPGGLPRGSVVAAGNCGLLCLALVAGASAAGAWCAIAGLPDLGVAAAADAGLDPGRLLLVADPGEGWPQVVATLLDGCELVLLRPPSRPSAQVRRRLEAVSRRHGGVLVVAGDWDGAQSRLSVSQPGVDRDRGRSWAAAGSPGTGGGGRAGRGRPVTGALALAAGPGRCCGCCGSGPRRAGPERAGPGRSARRAGRAAERGMSRARRSAG